MNTREVSPTSIRIPHLMPTLQMTAMEIDTSTNQLIRDILEEWLEKRMGHKRGYFKKIRQQKRA